MSTEDEVPVYTALAKDRPCEAYSHRRAPHPTRTQGHHLYPVYLQNRVYGRIQRGDIVWLCGLCHDAVHDWIAYRLGEARQPIPGPGRNHIRIAETALTWYRQNRRGEVTPKPD